MAALRSNIRPRALPIAAAPAPAIAATRALAITATLALAIAATVAAAAAAQGARHRHRSTAPSGFVGVNVSGPMLGGSVDLTQQFDKMVASGVGTVRLVFSWANAQPYASWSQVPADQRGQFVDAGGVPTNFTLTDQIVGLAAQRAIRLLPTVLYAPSWDLGKNADGGAAPPARTGPYASYLTALIDRYGPHGTFWQTHGPRRPVRMWQIWNEPNITVYWPQPFAGSYVKLLRAAHKAIKRADPGAKVVLAAITNVAWKDLARIYAIRGARRLFDVAAVNGFTSTPSRVLRFLQLVRIAMNRFGDQRKALLDTEMSWPTSVGKALEQFDWDTTEAGQARKIAAVLPKLAAQRRALGLASFYYYTWMDQGRQGAFSDFDFAGLSTYEPDGQVVAKPGLAAFSNGALAIEGCRAKGPLATRCLRH